MNTRTKPQRNPLKHNIYSRRSKCVDLNTDAWFSEFPGERESVTCWRELQSDKRRPHPLLLLEPLVLSHVRLFKHVVEMVVVVAVGVRRSASLNFCATINMEKEPRGQCGVIQSALARKLNHSHSCHAMSNRLAIQWSGKGRGCMCWLHSSSNCIFSSYSWSKNVSMNNCKQEGKSFLGLQFSYSSFNSKWMHKSYFCQLPSPGSFVWLCWSLFLRLHADKSRRFSLILECHN